MAEKREQINPKVAASTKALLMAYCAEKVATQADVVEAALLAFLQPQASATPVVGQLEALCALEQGQHGLEDMLRILNEKHDAQGQFLAEKLSSLEAGMIAMLPLLTTMIDKLEPAKEPPVPVAEPVELYAQFRRPVRELGPAPEAEASAGGRGEAEASAPGPAAPSSPPPPPGRWGRFLTRAKRLT